jgi:23S rRNA (adenine2503-C2)-methyltransferase
MRRQNLIGMTDMEMTELLTKMGEAPFRARQLYYAVYGRQCADFADMTDLSRSFRLRLAENFSLELPEIESLYCSTDGTEKYLLRLSDNHRIEMVHIPEPGRDTLCLSSQVGCSAACRFCVTATLGFKRNLTAGEIVGQVLLLSRRKPGILKTLNLVFMGMGEPLLNYEEVMKAFRLMADSRGLSISPRRITLSTCGIVPGLQRLAKETLIPQLAVSLGSPEDALRNELIPVNRKWDLKQLMQACRAVPVRKRITFEYTLLRGVNDRPEDARRLVRLLSHQSAKVNLIPLNPHPAIPFQRSEEGVAERFQSYLFDHGISAFLRKSRGEDIQAACGQLAAGAKSH